MAILLADAAAASQFFYKEAYLDYGQLVTDGFYHVRKQFSRLPTLGELEANPQLAGGQVVMVVDRPRDAPLVTLEGLVREQLPRLRTEADRAALLANLICEAFGNFMGVVQESSPQPALQQLQAAFGAGPIPVGELIAAGLGGARSRAIAFKAIADGLPSDAALQARLVRAPYPVTLMHELQLHAWNDVKADGRQYVVDLMDDAGALYEKASPEAAQYETLGREDDALLVKMLAAGLPKLPAGQYTCRGSDIIRDEVIGKGSSAEVYKVITSNGTTIAVKRMTEPEQRHQNGAAQLFQDEVQVLATLDHPNITRLLGACETRNELFIMMEYLEGGTLVDLLSGVKELSTARRLEIALDVGLGLAYLHSATPAVIHRDVKGNNVLIAPDGTAKLTDFGVSVIMTNNADTIQQVGPNDTHPHTLRYAAPEVLEGEPVNDRSDVYAYGMLLYEIFSGNAPWAQTFPQQIKGLVLAQKRPPMPAEAKHGMPGLIQACWAHKPQKRPAMPEVITELLQVAYNYLWDTSGRGSLGAADMKLLVACTRPRGETSRKAAQRQEFAARQLGVLAGPDGDAAARAAMGPAGAVPALLALLERGTDKGKEAAAEALGALVWVSFADPGQRDEMRGQVLPALLHLLGATSHDGCRIASLAALKTMAASPGTSDFRTAMVGAGGISALVSALQDGSMRAKAAASRLLLGFAAEGPESQEWIAAAPGSIAALVDLLRASDMEAVATAAQTLIILVDIPHTRTDALAAGAVANVVRLLGPASDEGVTPTEELAAILLSKLALEPDSHSQVARAGAIPVLVRLIAQSRDAGRERMLIGVLRALGAVSEDSTANAAKVIAARGVVPAFQLLGSRLPAVRRAAAFTLGCLFSSDAAPSDVTELTNIEGRLTHYLADLLIMQGRERDQAYGAVMMARVLTASVNAVSVAKELVGDDRPLGALITMLASWEEPIRLAAVRALAKITWLGVDPGKPPPTLAHAFRTRGTVEGSIAIRNLAEMLESDTELTRYTAAKVLIALWTSGRFFQEEIARAAAKPTAIALAETLQMAGGGASRTDVMELCAAVLHVKSGPSTLEGVKLCPDWAAFFWAPAAEVSGPPDGQRRESQKGYPDVRRTSSRE